MAILIGIEIGKGLINYLVGFMLRTALFAYRKKCGCHSPHPHHYYFVHVQSGYPGNPYLPPDSVPPCPPYSPYPSYIL